MNEKQLMKPRVLVIHRALAPYRIEFFNELYARYQADIYFEYKQPREQHFDQELWKERIKFPYKYLKKGPSFLPNWRKDIFKLYQKKEYDIIILSELNIGTAGLISLRAINPKRTRIFTICDDNINKAKNIISQKFNKKKLLLSSSSIDGVIVCDSRAEKVYRNYFKHGERFVTLPIIQDDRFLRTQYQKVADLALAHRKKWQEAYGENSRYILFVGRLAKEKNLPLLLEAFEEKYANAKNIHLLIVGEGEERATIEQKIASLSSRDQIHLLGKKQGKALYTFYAAADAFILPSQSETFGAVVNEALVFGLPTAVANNIGAASLYNSSMNNLSLFPYNDKEKIGEAMQKILEIAGDWNNNRPSKMPFSFEERLQIFWNDFEQLFPDYLKGDK